MTDANMREPDRVGWPIYAIVTAAILATGVINALSTAHEHARDGGAYLLGKPLFGELTSVGVIAALTPAVASAVRLMRVAARQRRWWKFVALAVAVIIGFSAVHIVGMVALRQIAAALDGRSYHFEWTASELAYEFRKDLATFVLLGLTFWLALRRRDDTAARDVAAAPPIAMPATPADHLWLRDGTTSIRIDTGEVLWVTSAGNYVEYRLASGTTHLIRATLSKEEPRLQPFGIVRVHRTRMVNLNRVIGVATRATGDFDLRLDNGETLTGSRRYRAAIGRLADDGAALVPLTKGQEGRDQGLAVR